MKQLAQRYPWIDIDRAGIYGHSGGGLPNRRHGFGSEPYMVRRRWDYFVRYLLGLDPPKKFELKPPAPRTGPPR